MGGGKKGGRGDGSERCDNVCGIEKKVDDGRMGGGVAAGRVRIQERQKNGRKLKLIIDFYKYYLRLI